jgi:hypothetical protein
MGGCGCCGCEENTIARHARRDDRGQGRVHGKPPARGQAYGLAYAQSLDETVNSSMSRSQRYFLANEAGQKATIDTAKIAGYFGVTATALTSLPAGHVEILLGTGSASGPAGLAPATAPAATPSASSTSTSAGNNGAAGSAVTVTSNTTYGIPCVY